MRSREERGKIVRGEIEEEEAEEEEKERREDEVEGGRRGRGGQEVEEKEDKPWEKVDYSSLAPVPACIGVYWKLGMRLSQQDPCTHKVTSHVLTPCQRGSQD